MARQVTPQQIPENAFLRLPQILAIYPVGRSTWWAGVKSGIYPAGVKISERCTAWRAADILALINQPDND